MAKPFAWSYSKLKNFAVCPRKHYEVDVVKRFKEAESDILKWGNEVHAALAQRLLPGGVALPASMQQFEEIAQKVEATPGKRLVEQKYTLTEMMQPTEWFAPNAWVRSVADVLILNPPKAHALDWKLGKVLDDSQQLALMAACVFAYYPDIQKVQTGFIWLKVDEISRQDFTRADLPKIWLNLMPRVRQLKHAYDTNSFPPMPGRLCQHWCPVTSCENHGRDFR
jgi:hypothetical protein